MKLTSKIVIISKQTQIKIILLAIIFNFNLLVNKVSALENKILFKVNNEIITSVDILNEIKYLKIINDNLIKTDDNEMFEISKKSLIREKIKKIELLKYFDELKLDDEYLNKLTINYFNDKIGIKTILEFEKYFTELKINPDLIKKKLLIEILWNQLIFNKFNKNVKIDKNSIKKELSNLNIQTEYLISEIVFDIKSDETLDKKYKIIINKIKEKNFSEAASIFSISNTSNIGGKLGWIKESSMNKKIKNILKNTTIGTFTSPITIPGGFLILSVDEKRETKQKYDLDKEIKIIAQKKTNEQLNQFSIIYFNKIKKDININEL